MLQVSGSGTVTPATRVVVVGTGGVSDKQTAKAQATFASAFQQAQATVVVAGDAASSTGGVVVRDPQRRHAHQDARRRSTTPTPPWGRSPPCSPCRAARRPAAYGIGANADSPYPKLTS